MDIRRSLEILELGPEASMDEARQAYKDLVNIWHPDRFPQNPRLKDRAEKKLKEINAAYEAVEAYLTSPRARIETNDLQTHGESRGTQRTRAPDKAEVMAETGTRFVLAAWHNISEAFRRLVREATREELAGTGRTPQDQGANRRQGSPEERGRGAGRGRGKGGMGRGGGRGMGRGKGPGPRGGRR